MEYSDTKIVYLTAGAGGMFCGSCMHDNALAKALAEQGWDIQLVPTYTPIRTDESNVSVDQVLFGGINVYLQQKVPLLRYVPSVLDRFLDSPWLIRKVTSRAIETDATMLGKLAYSMLLGSQGNQRKEVRKLCKWLVLSQPDLVVFSNVLIGGCIEDIKQATQVPVLVTLQGDDVFLDSLKEPFRSKCINRIKEIVERVDGFIVQSEFFREYMSDYFSIARERIYVTPLGLDMQDFVPFLNYQRNTSGATTKTIGYMARLANEKGLHHLVDAFLKLKSKPGTAQITLKIAGWLSPENRQYAETQWKRLNDAGWEADYEYLGTVDRETKLEFFKQIDVLSVPTEFQEPKGLYALESLAAGVPVVLPAHGSFPELVEQTQGGLLFEPGNTSQLAQSLVDILERDDFRRQLGRRGQQYVHQHRNSESMATATSRLIENFCRPPQSQ